MTPRDSGLAPEAGEAEGTGVAAVADELKKGRRLSERRTRAKPLSRPGGINTF
jgi:hypothetical protein